MGGLSVGLAAGLLPGAVSVERGASPGFHLILKTDCFRLKRGFMQISGKPGDGARLAPVVASLA
jgi:hypothetical protein